MGNLLTQHMKQNSDPPASVQVPAQVKNTSPQAECSSGSKEQQQTIPQLPASNFVHRTYKRAVRNRTTENLHSKEAETQTKTVDKSQSQKSNSVLPQVNEASTDMTCCATDRNYDIAEQSTSTKLHIAKVPVATPTEPPDHSRQMSSPPKAQVNNEENTQDEQCLNPNSVTNEAVDYHISAKSESSCANAAKIRLRQKFVKKIKTLQRDEGKICQQTAEETVTDVEESSQQQGCIVMEENTIKKPETHQKPQTKQADNDTNGNTVPLKVNVKALAPQVPFVDEIPTATPNNAATHNPTAAAPDTSIRLQQKLKLPLPQDNAGKPKKKGTLRALKKNKQKGDNCQVEKQEAAITSAVTAEGRWHPFTVKESCSHKARCKHNPGAGLPPNIQKWFYECPNHLCQPQRLAAGAARREAMEEGEDSHQ